MTSEMIERVARALVAEDAMPLNCGWSEDERLEYAEDHWRAYENEARAALVAMREPTPEMVLAAVNTHPKDIRLGACIPTARWQAMIDEALK